MGVSYWKADAETLEMAREIIEEHRPDLAHAEINIGVLVALSDNDDGHPLKVGGWPCEARVSVVSLKNRALGCPDALIEIDGSVWRELNDGQRAALLHHEIHHIELAEPGKEDEGHRTDDLGRPVVKLRKHDYQCGGFREIHELYGDDSPERRGLNAAEEALNQRVFQFATAEAV